MRLLLRSVAVLLLIAGIAGCKNKVKECNDAKAKAALHWSTLAALTTETSKPACHGAANHAEDMARSGKLLEAKDAALSASIACAEEKDVAYRVKSSEDAYKVCSEVEN